MSIAAIVLAQIAIMRKKHGAEGDMKNIILTTNINEYKIIIEI